MKEMLTRITTAVILIPGALFVLYRGGLALVIAMLIVVAIGSAELIGMLRKAKLQVSYFWIYICSFGFLGMLYLPGWDAPILWFLLLLAIVENAWGWSMEQSVPRLLATLFMVVYTVVFPLMLTRVGLDHPDEKILLALILMIWIVDSSAYFIGMRFGKRRNITAISPRKSREGFIAGMLAPWLVVVILYVMHVTVIPIGVLALIALAAGVFGQLGDLLESMLKRYCDVKDSSNLIPGHGGVLDRSDSILLAGSYLYCALLVLEKVR